MRTHSETLKTFISTLELEAKAIADCAKKLGAAGSGDAAAKLEAVIELIKSRLDLGGKLVVIGLGKSGKVAQKIAATLSSTGSPAVYLHPTEALHGDIGMVGSSDVALALSYTGNTEELVRLIPSLKALHIPVIGMGGNPESQLAARCDHWIDAHVEQEACPHNLAPTSSTTLSLALGDALAMALMKVRNFDAGSFAKNHPGGALGRRLTLRVADVVHQGNAVPVVKESASMDEVIVRSTEKKLGAVLVEGASGKLAGIITDGDIRRALQHREKFFGMKAAEVMTRQPVTALPEMMAQQALELMENRPSQISVLPVVDGDGKWVGLVRLHDLIKSL